MENLPMGREVVSASKAEAQLAATLFKHSAASVCSGSGGRTSYGEHAAD